MRGRELCQHLWPCCHTKLHLLVVLPGGTGRTGPQAWAGPGGHVDDLNVGRMQPPAAFPMDVM